MSTTFSSNATSTYTYAVGASVSAEVKLAIFAKVKATVNGSISTSKTSTFGESVTVTVPPHSTVYGDHGKLIEYTYGYAYTVKRDCTRTPITYTTFRAPYRINWHVY
jgi:hypothetical protein